MPDAIVEHVFRFVIEEAYSITREVQTASVEQLDKLMSLTPVRMSLSSPFCYTIEFVSM